MMFKQKKRIFLDIYLVIWYELGIFEGVVKKVYYSGVYKKNFYDRSLNIFRSTFKGIFKDVFWKFLELKNFWNIF